MAAEEAVVEVAVGVEAVEEEAVAEARPTRRRFRARHRWLATFRLRNRGLAHPTQKKSVLNFIQ